MAGIILKDFNLSYLRERHCKHDFQDMLNYISLCCLYVELIAGSSKRRHSLEHCETICFQTDGTGTEIVLVTGILLCGN